MQYQETTSCIYHLVHHNLSGVPFEYPQEGLFLVYVMCFLIHQHPFDKEKNPILQEPVEGL